MPKTEDKPVTQEDMLKGKDKAPRWWWLSISDQSKPEGARFVGAGIVKATCAAGALAASLRFNSGGAIMFVEIPPGVEPEAGEVDRLLSKVETYAAIKRLFPGILKERAK